MQELVFDGQVLKFLSYVGIIRSTYKKCNEFLLLNFNKVLKNDLHYKYLEFDLSESKDFWIRNMDPSRGSELYIVRKLYFGEDKCGTISSSNFFVCQAKNEI